MNQYSITGKLEILFILFENLFIRYYFDKIQKKMKFKIERWNIYNKFMKNLEEKRFWIWFSMVENLGSRRKQKLLEIFKNPEKIYNLSKKDLMEIDGIGEKLAENIIDEKIKKQVDEQIRKMKELDVDIISINDESYPQVLKNIYDYPISLFVKGNIKNLQGPSIAIIGCREASEYGKKAAKYFGYSLAKSGFNIVSGLAKGVDSYSHIGNLNAKKVDKLCTYGKNNMKVVDKLSTCGKVVHNPLLPIGNPIAVVGSGLDIIYPRENEILQNEILSVGGTVISEYPLGTMPDKMNFPARNRIISGLSEAVLVIEAKKKSGTLLTVDFALEQGKEVFVVPRKY